MQFLQKYWFLIGLASAILLGHFFAKPLQPISHQIWLRNAIVMSVMFLMALPLPLATIMETVKNPWASLLATTVNFGLFPLVAWLLAPAVDPMVRSGFLVVAATPCTLASAAVWTRRANGNDVTALMTTVITNTLSFVLTPLIVYLLIRESADIPFSDMVLKLGLLVLLPMLVAQVLSARKTVGKWAAQRKSSLSTLAQVGILMIVLLGTSQTMLKLPTDQMPEILGILGLVGICCILHLCILVSGLILARGFRCSRGNQIAVAISGSQKTLMIGILVCIQLNVSLLPMVIYHAAQLTIDTFVADLFRARSSHDLAGDKSPPSPGEATSLDR